MKKHYILFIFAMLLAACSSHSDEAEAFLNHTETLLKSDPQSAYDSLVAKKPQVSDWSHSLQMRYWFDYIDAKNQYYIPLDEQEDLDRMTEVADYYDGDDEREARAYYLLGSVYRDHNDGPMAIQYWQKGIEKAKSKKQKDNRLIALAYRQMGRIFADQLLTTESKNCFDSAYYYGIVAKDTLIAVYAYMDKNEALYLEHNYDSVLIRCKKLSQTLHGTKYDYHAARSLAISSLICQERGKNDLAEKYLEEYEAGSHLFDSNGNVEYGAEAYYYIKGMCLLGLGKLDDSKKFFEKLYNSTQDWNSKEGAYKGLSMYYEKVGRLDSALFYSRLQHIAADSSYFQQNAVLSIQFNKTYNYSQHQRIAQEASLKSSKLQTYIIVLVLFLVFGVIITWSRFRYIRTKQSLKHEKLKSIVANYTSELAQLRVDILEKEKQLEKVNCKIRDQQALINEALLAEEKEAILNDLEQLRKNKEQQEKANIYTSDIIKVLRDKVRMNKHASDDNLHVLEGYARIMYPSLFKVLDSIPKGPNEVEVCVCILKKLNFSNQQIALLLSKQESTVCTIRSRIYKKTHNGETASMKNIDQWIINL